MRSADGSNLQRADSKPRIAGLDENGRLPAVALIFLIAPRPPDCRQRSATRGSIFASKSILVGLSSRTYQNRNTTTAVILMIAVRSACHLEATPRTSRSPAPLRHTYSADVSLSSTTTRSIAWGVMGWHHRFSRPIRRPRRIRFVPRRNHALCPSKEDARVSIEKKRIDCST